MFPCNPDAQSSVWAIPPMDVGALAKKEALRFIRIPPKEPAEPEIWYVVEASPLHYSPGRPQRHSEIQHADCPWQLHMTAPASHEPNHFALKPAIGWLLAVAAIYGGVAWFSLENLQNNSDIKRLDIWFGIPELLGEFVVPTVVPNQPLPPPSGWRFFPERMDSLVYAFLVIAFCRNWGNLVVRKWIPRDEWGDRLERLYWALVTGIAVFGTLTLLLGLVGGSPFISVFAIAGGPTVIKHLAGWRDIDILPAATKPTSIWSGFGIACAIAIAPFLLAMLLGSLQPPNDFDVKEYHLEGAKEFYLRGRVEMLPHNVYTSFPFLTEMLCLAGMVLQRDWFSGALVGQAVLAAFAPITALGLFIAARRWLGTTAGWFAVLIHLTCPWTYRISIIAYAEGGLACFLFAAFFAALRAIEATEPRIARRWTLLTGILAGAAAGCKYPAVLTVVIPLGGLIVGWAILPVSPLHVQTLEGTGWKARPTTAIRLGLHYSLGVLLTFGPWLGKNLCETGNPVYPLLYSVFGGTDWDEASNAKWKAGHPLPLKDITGPRWIVRDTRDRLWDVFLGSDWQSALYLSLGVAALFAIWRTRALSRSVGFIPRGLGRPPDAWTKVHATRVLLLTVAYSLWLFWTWQFFTHRIDRFWVPMLPLLSLLAGAGLAALWESVEEFMPNRTREVYFVLRGVIALPIFGVVLFNLALATSPLGGNNSYLMDMESLRQLTKTPCIAFVESLSLAPTDKVLLVGEAEMFDAAFPYEYNTVFDHSIFERDCSAAQPNIAAKDQPLRPKQEIGRASCRERV